MDPVTHAALGATLGEMTLGEKLGRKAMLYGAVAGMLPDVDTLLAPFEDGLSLLTNHRGLTHSLLFAVLASVVLAGLLVKRHRTQAVPISFGVALVFFLLCLVSHVLLDACTTYGTLLFLPLSHYRVAFNILFIVDPFFTFPLLVCVVLAGVWRINQGRRRLVLCVGLTMSFFYVGFSCCNKYAAQRALAEALEGQHVAARRSMTTPGPLNTVLWYCLAETDDGYWLGHYSVLDTKRPIELAYVPRNEKLIENIRDTAVVARLVRFSDGYYRVRQEEGNLVLDVLKFGLFPAGRDREQAAFCFAIEQRKDGRVIATNVAHFRHGDLGRLLKTVWRQVWGRERPDPHCGPRMALR